LAAALLAAPHVQAATFGGSARVEITDSTGALSPTNIYTVSCWMKISLPTGASFSEDMTILVDRTTGNDTTPYCYWIRFSRTSGNVEFLTKGTSGTFFKTLIRLPHLERWYHLAVVRSGESVAGYVDGREMFNTGGTIGNSAHVNNVSIGSWPSMGSGQYFRGEVQELAIYQGTLSKELISDLMFQDQSAIPNLVGYYKLAASDNTADHLKNFAPSPPSGTDPAMERGSGLAFEATNEAGEQSAFDSKKNGGRDAIAPLSGAFTWDRSIFMRPTPGVPFNFRIGYSSANSVGRSTLGGFDPFESGPMGKGWRHSFETRVLPSQYFSPKSDTDVLGLMTWNGAIETWDLTNGVYRTRHKGYRGELTLDGSGCEWKTPDRMILRFRHPNSGAAVMRGRLVEIRDLNSNAVRFGWNETLGLMTQAVDTAGGRCDFYYDAQNRITGTAYLGWSAQFQYDADGYLTNSFVTGPSQYASLNTAWSCTYSNGLIRALIDPRGNTNAIVRFDDYGRLIETKDALGRASTTAYMTPGLRQITRTDAGGYPWIETHDRQGRVIATRNPLGQTTTFAYDEAGNRTSTTEPLGWTTYTAYDAQANRISETNALGEVRNWTYDLALNKPLTETDPLGWVTHFQYDSAGNLIRHYDDIGNLSQFTYYPNGQIETAADANGHATRSEYDASGFLIARTAPGNNTWQYTPNEFGWVTSETDPLGQVTTYSHDINGRVVHTVDPLFREYRSGYDANGNLTEAYDAKGQVTRNVFDAANQKIQMTDRANGVWKYTYTSRGKAQFAIDALSVTNSFGYDEANRPTGGTDPYGFSVETTYDANGNAVATKDKLGRRWRKTYDRLNRVIEESDPFGHTKSTTFDAAGRARTVTAPNGYVSTYAYDGRGRMTTWVDAESYVWKYTYDGVGNILDVEDALGGHYVMEYGDRNERIMERNQDLKEWHYRYDALLRPDQQTDPNRTVRTVTYDAGGRIDYVSLSTGRVDDYGYDENNNIVLLSRSRPGDPPTSTMFAYDILDRVTEVTDTFSKRVRYGYDKVGRVTSLTYPDNKVLTQGFDKLGRLTSQTYESTFNTAYAYDAADRMVFRSYPNGIVQSNSFDEAGRLFDLRYVQSGGAVLSAWSQGYDKNGNRTDSTALGTLDWPDPSSIDETARYTASGRLIDRVDAAKTNQNTWVYHYDESGNMTNCVGGGESFGFTYDEDNRVTVLDYDGGTSAALIRNRYDALGRRIARTKDGSETRYALDLQGSMERILCDMTPAGQITAHYVHGPDLCYKVETNGALVCYHADAQANIVSLTDAGATNVAQYAYTAFGRSLEDTNSRATEVQPYRFVGVLGAQEDLGDVYFMRARYYSPSAGSFFSPDPVRKIKSGWKSCAYAYCGNNPLANVDPNGSEYTIYEYDLFVGAPLVEKVFGNVFGLPGFMDAAKENDLGLVHQHAKNNETGDTFGFGDDEWEAHNWLTDILLRKRAIATVSDEAVQYTEATHEDWTFSYLYNNCQMLMNELMLNNNNMVNVEVIDGAPERLSGETLAATEEAEQQNAANEEAARQNRNRSYRATAKMYFRMSAQCAGIAAENASTSAYYMGLYRRDMDLSQAGEEDRYNYMDRAGGFRARGDEFQQVADYYSDMARMYRKEARSWQRQIQ